VPTQKYSKFTAAIKPLNHKMLWPVRTYSTSTNKEQDQHNTNIPNFNKDSINPLVYVNALSRKHSCETKDKMSKTHGNLVNIYEKCSSKGFELIGSFVSPRKAANFLAMSGSIIIKYMQSGAIFKDKYKFSSAPQPQSSRRCLEDPEAK
jgi:hypothetical protein